MTTEGHLALLKVPPFPWLKFQEIFKFGDTETGESLFDELIEYSLEICRDNQEREALLRLIDNQLSAFIDQVHTQREFLGLGDITHRNQTHESLNWEFELYQASAKRQVISSARRKYDLKPKSRGDNHGAFARKQT